MPIIPLLLVACACLSGVAQGTPVVEPAKAPTPVPVAVAPPAGVTLPPPGIRVLIRDRDEVKSRTPIPGKPVRYVRMPSGSVRIDQKKPYLRIYYWPPVAPEEASAPKDAPPTKRLAHGVTLDPIYFPFNESEFVAPSTHLAGIADWLKADPINAVTLVGHADPRGTKARNDKISLERAETVKAALVGLGAPADRVLTEGKGSSAPAHKGKSTESNHWGSRRVEPRLHAVGQPFLVTPETTDKPCSNHS